MMQSIKMPMYVYCCLIFLFTFVLFESVTTFDFLFCLCANVLALRYIVVKNFSFDAR